MSAARVVVLGSSNMDLIAHCQRFPSPAETVTGAQFQTAAGGKGANQAVAAARMGASVAFVGSLGEDAFGATLRAGLAAEGIDVSHLKMLPSTATGVALIVVDGAGQNMIIVAPGANALVTERDVELAADVIANAALLVCQLETPLPAVERAIQVARQSRVPILLNPAPARPLSDALLAMVDYLAPNEIEAGMLAGDTVSNVEDAMRAAEKLRQHGARHVLLTLGALGVVLADDAGIRHTPAPRVTAVDTTGAGDTFIGAFAAATVEGKSMDEAVAFGQRAAAISVTRYGAQPSIPTRQEVDMVTSM